MSFLIIWPGCGSGSGDGKTEKETAFLIRTPLLSLSVQDFLEELDLKKSAYPYNIKEEPDAYNDMVIHLTAMLSDEMVLLSAAADLGVTVTEEEVQAAETEFRKEYPDDGFEKMLLENVISYSLWKKRLKNSMVIEKFIDRELISAIEIRPEEIVAFYNAHYGKKDARKSGDKTGESRKPFDENELVSVLRMQKTQACYDEWVKELERKYPVDIDHEKLKSLLINME